MNTSRVGKALLIAMVVLLLVPALGITHAVAASGPPPEIGTLRPVKTVPLITLSDKITVVLTITNNSSLPLSNIEIYEYFNPSFTLSGFATVTQSSGTATLPLSQSTTVTQVQAILDPPLPDSLQPGQSMSVKYVEAAAGPGDFQIPAALVWFTYNIGTSEIRTSFYSNGIVVHIASETEKLVLLVYPYVLAATTFTATMTILFWARRQLRLIEKKKLSR